MSAIRVKTIIDSDTLYLPELRPFIGHSVEITVVDEGTPDVAEQNTFWKTKTLDDLAAAQGIGTPAHLDQMYGDWNERDFEGFDEAVQNWRDSGPSIRGRG